MRALFSPGKSPHHETRRLDHTLAAAALLAGCAHKPVCHLPIHRTEPARRRLRLYRKPGWATHTFAVAAANPLATDAGYQVLRAGGSALDAAIAVQMVLTLVEPQSSGIGGGAFSSLRRQNGRSV